MSDDLYRDAHVGLRARIGELEARIQDRDAEVTEAFWEALTPEAREHLVALRSGRELLRADSLDELTRAESMLAAYLAELDRLIAELPALEDSWMEVPDDVADPPDVRGGWNFDDYGPSEEEAADVLRRLTALVRAHDPEAEVVGESPVYLARFRSKGCPFVLRSVLHTQGNRQVAEVAMLLVTSIPRALPPLVVRHETLVLTIGTALGLKQEVEVGEPSFDGLFLIEGTKAAANLFLVPSVRSQLLALSRFDIPILDVNPMARVASLRWRFEPASRALHAAMSILTAVRETPPSVQFRSRSSLSEDDP